jgi:hypothetical protein
MRKVFIGFMVLVMLFGLVSFIGCGKAYDGGGGGSNNNNDNGNDSALITQQIRNLETAIKSYDTVEALSIISSQFRLEISEEGETEIVDKATLEAMVGEYFPFIAPYLNSIEVETLTYDIAGITVYPGGVVGAGLTATSLASAGAVATTEGSVTAYVRTTNEILINPQMFDPEAPYMEIPIPKGTCISMTTERAPLLFTKEANTNSASDWKILNADTNAFGDDPEIFDIVSEINPLFIASIPGVQSVASATLVITPESSLANEDFITINIQELTTEDPSGPEFACVGANPGLTANTVYSPVLTESTLWGTTGTLNHQYATRVAQSGSNTISGQLVNNSTKLTGVYLVPWSIIDEIFVTLFTELGGSSIKKMAGPDTTAVEVALYSGFPAAYAIRSNAVTSGSNFQFTNVPDGSYVIFASEVSSTNGKIGLSNKESITYFLYDIVDGTSFEVSSDITGMLVTLEAAGGHEPFPSGP